MLKCEICSEISDNVDWYPDHMNMIMCAKCAISEFNSKRRYKQAEVEGIKNKIEKLKSKYKIV